MSTLFHYIEDNEQYPKKHEEPSQCEKTYREQQTQLELALTKTFSRGKKEK